MWEGVGKGQAGGREKTYVALEGAALVDREEEDDVPACGVGFGEDLAVLDLGCPEALSRTGQQLGIVFLPEKKKKCLRLPCTAARSPR